MAETAGARAGDVIYFGHTHRPWHREVEGIHFVNTSSVGRPKDGDWRAGYVLLDMGGEAPAVEFVRVEYDLDAAMEGVLNSELPDGFAGYLRTGRRRQAAARCISSRFSSLRNTRWDRRRPGANENGRGQYPDIADGPLRAEATSACPPRHRHSHSAA
jgi:hypothetical protein